MRLSVAAFAVSVVPGVAVWMRAYWRRRRVEAAREVAAVQSRTVPAAVVLPLRSAVPPAPTVWQTPDAAKADPCLLTRFDRRAFARAVHAFDFETAVEPSYSVPFWRRLVLALRREGS